MFQTTNQEKMGLEIWSWHLWSSNYLIMLDISPNYWTIIHLLYHLIMTSIKTSCYPTFLDHIPHLSISHGSSRLIPWGRWGPCPTIDEHPTAPAKRDPATKLGRRAGKVNEEALQVICSLCVKIAKPWPLKVREFSHENWWNMVIETMVFISLPEGKSCHGDDSKYM